MWIVTFVILNGVLLCTVTLTRNILGLIIKLQPHGSMRMCISIESEGIMENYDYNDDFASVIDQGIFTNGVCDAYRNGEKHEWIIKVGNEFLRDGLQHLNERQIGILESLFFEGKCLQDICNKYCLSHEELLKEIGTMKITLVKYL